MGFLVNMLLLISHLGCIPALYWARLTHRLYMQLAKIVQVVACDGLALHPSCVFCHVFYTMDYHDPLSG